MYSQSPWATDCSNHGRDISFPALAEAPSPVSELVGEFVRESDSEFGYEMLRPQAWEAVNLADSRRFLLPDSAGKDERILIAVTNLDVLAQRLAGGNTLIAPFMQFQETPTLSSWMQARERAWQNEGLSVQLLQSLPNAAIYLYNQVPNQLHLIAYVIDSGQPLVISLYGFGAYSDLEWLTEEGLLADFETMVLSAAALPAAAQLRDDSSEQTEFASLSWVERGHGESVGPGYWASLLARWRDGGGYIHRAINKQTTPNQHWVSDDYWPYYSNAAIGAQTHHLMVYGDPAIVYCTSHQPFY